MPAPPVVSDAVSVLKIARMMQLFLRIILLRLIIQNVQSAAPVSKNVQEKLLKHSNYLIVNH